MVLVIDWNFELTQKHACVCEVLIISISLLKRGAAANKIVMSPLPYHVSPYLLIASPVGHGTAGLILFNSPSNKMQGVL